MNLITDLEEVYRLATLKENENMSFRQYLKGQSSTRIDRIVYRLNKAISKEIDCTKCANCCKSQLPVLDSNDIDNFIEGINITRDEFIREFLVVSSDFVSEYEFNVENELCPFLREKKCSNYTYRPKNCQSYPHLNKDRFISRTFTVINNTFICPIVFNVVEALKIEIGFRL